MLELKKKKNEKSVAEMNAFDGPRKDCVSLKICLYRLPKLKNEEKRGWKKLKHNIQQQWGNQKRCNLCRMGFPEEKRAEEWQKYLKQ